MGTQLPPFNPGIGGMPTQQQLLAMIEKLKAGNAIPPGGIMAQQTSMPTPGIIPIGGPVGGNLSQPGPFPPDVGVVGGSGSTAGSPPMLPAIQGLASALTAPGATAGNRLDANTAESPPVQPTLMSAMTLGDARDAATGMISAAIKPPTGAPSPYLPQTGDNPYLPQSGANNLPFQSLGPSFDASAIRTDMGIGGATAAPSPAPIAPPVLPSGPMSGGLAPKGGYGGGVMTSAPPGYDDVQLMPPGGLSYADIGQPDPSTVPGPVGPMARDPLVDAEQAKGSTGGSSAPATGLDTAGQAAHELGAGSGEVAQGQASVGIKDIIRAPFNVIGNTLDAVLGGLGFPGPAKREAMAARGDAAELAALQQVGTGAGDMPPDVYQRIFGRTPEQVRAGPEKSHPFADFFLKGPNDASAAAEKDLEGYDAFQKATANQIAQYGALQGNEGRSLDLIGKRADPLAGVNLTRAQTYRALHPTVSPEQQKLNMVLAAQASGDPKALKEAMDIYTKSGGDMKQLTMEMARSRLNEQERAQADRAATERSKWGQRLNARIGALAKTYNVKPDELPKAAVDAIMSEFPEANDPSDPDHPAFQKAWFGDSYSLTGEGSTRVGDFRAKQAEAAASTESIGGVKVQALPDDQGGGYLITGLPGRPVPLQMRNSHEETMNYVKAQLGKAGVSVP